VASTALVECCFRSCVSKIHVNNDLISLVSLEEGGTLRIVTIVKKG
jgi:hypothetical protein